MASTYGNDLRLEEIGDGEQSGTWGATTNTNLELISEALSFGTEGITTNADTHTTTIADGASDPGRSLYLKYTGTLDSACTITIAPNSISKTWYIENGTSGSQSIIISQGSGANVTIKTGQTKIVYSDGAGSTAAMAEIGTLGVTNLAVGGNIDVDGVTNLDAVDIDGAVQLDATLTVGANDQGYDVTLHGDTAARNVVWDSSADSLIFSDNAKAVFGAGSDLQLYHTGSGSVISEQGTGDLNIQTNGANIALLGNGGSEYMANFASDGAAKLFFNNGEKIATTATGITVAGSVVDNLTRGSIKVGNSSGVFAELTKGGAATVLTSDGTDLSWAEAGGGGGEQTFTATGAISAGNLVGFNANGTISASVAELQAAVAQGSGSSGYQTLVYDTANDKVLLFFYAYASGANNLYGRVGTMANGQISFGTAVNANIRARDIHAAYDANSGKTVVTASQNGGNNRPYAVVVTVSGTNLSFGTPVEMASNGNYDTVVRYDSNAQKVLCIFHGNGGSVRARVGTVSGTSISFGSEATVSSSGAATGKTSLTFDSNVNKFLMLYQNYGTEAIKGSVLTVSGTSVSKGTDFTITSSFNNAGVRGTFLPSLNKIIFMNNYGSTTYYNIVTINGTGITENSVDVQYTGYGLGNAFVTVAGDKKFLGFKDSGDTMAFVEVEITATEMKFGPTSQIIRWGAGTSGDSVFDPDTGNIVFADPSNVRVFNPTAPSFVGIAAENISNGATGKVTVAGGINTSVSGLTAGKEYGSIASSASLTEVGIDGVGAIGVALSSSSFYLNVGKL